MLDIFHRAGTTHSRNDALKISHNILLNSFAQLFNTLGNTSSGPGALPAFIFIRFRRTSYSFTLVPVLNFLRQKTTPIFPFFSEVVAIKSSVKLIKMIMRRLYPRIRSRSL